MLGFNAIAFKHVKLNLRTLNIPFINIHTLTSTRDFPVSSAYAYLFTDIHTIYHMINICLVSFC